MKVKDTISDIETNNSVIEIDNKLNFVKVEATGFQDLCNRISELEAKNRRLEAKNKALRKEYDDFYMKEYMPRIDECNRLWSELFDIKHLSLWEFARKYCSDDDLEEAGHQLARSLGVGQ